MKNFFKNHLPGFITRNIVLLSLVSFFTDIASEMLYPVTPLYLKEVGYSILLIGLLEGVAELTAGVIKLYAGALSDQKHKRNLFVQLGYGISAIAKPMIGFVTSYASVFGLRFMDRVGKGIRTAPRDALLTDESTPENRARVFGFHRSFDTLGATVGPAITFIVLFFYGDFHSLFMAALIPGICAVVLTFYLSKEKKPTTITKVIESITPKKKINLSPRAFVDFFKNSSPDYKKLFIGFSIFALINGSNVFLLLRAKEVGISSLYILGAYVLYNLVYALASYPVGVLTDKFGFKNIYIVGILIFSICYGVFGFQSMSPSLLLVTFGVYGIFSAIEDGMGKAWLSLHISKDKRATGLGFYMLGNSVAFFVASLATGAMWQYLGGQNTFITLSVLALIPAIYFIWIKLNPKPVLE